MKPHQRFPAAYKILARPLPALCTVSRLHENEIVMSAEVTPDEVRRERLCSTEAAGHARRGQALLSSHGDSTVQGEAQKLGFV